MRVNSQVYWGPNHYADFPGVLTRFQGAPAHKVKWSVLKKALLNYIDDLGDLGQDTVSGEELTFAQCCALTLQAIYRPYALEGRDRYRWGEGKAEEGCWIYHRWVGLEAMELIIKVAVRLTKIACFGLGDKEHAPGRAELERQLSRAKIVDIREEMQYMLKVALSRNIPSYPIVRSSSRFIQFGQGAKSTLTWNTVTEKDSHIGKELAHDKKYSNEYIRRLGFPGVLHHVVRDLEGAKKVWAHLRGPIVVKPVAGGMGNGVSVMIENEKELEVAIEKATPYAREGILVERYVAGVDHRLMVFNGELIWVSAKHPAQVKGDGVHNVKQLIDIENQLRKNGENSKKLIAVDEDLSVMLKRQGLDINSIPEAGREVKLGMVANLEKGATRDDVTELVHPDNRHMAQDIARLYRMKALGIDFVISDISRSWKETDCAIIEVNQMPGFSAPWQAEKIVDQMFPDKSNGRIPSVLMVESSAEQLAAVVKFFKEHKINLGQALPEMTIINEHDRGRKGDAFSLRVQSLLADPDCEAILMVVSEENISRFGLPVDQLEMTVVGKALSPELTSLLQRHSEVTLTADQDLLSLETALRDTCL